MRKNQSIRNLIGILTIGLIGLSIISCQFKKVTSNPESEFYTDSIYSKQLSEFRKHSVYLPKGFNKENKYPIIYATDGSKIKENNFYKKTLDSLIDNHVIKPIIFITSHSNNKVADSTSTTLGDGKKVYLQFRNFEYVDRKPTRIEDSLLVDRFKNHMLYFKDELISKIENEFNQKLNKNDRYFYGVSNGAGFGLSLLNTYPNTIGTYICFSTFGGDIQFNTWKEDVKYPRLYMQYGSKEPFFLKEDAEFLKSKYEQLSLFSEINEFNGGHEYKKWNEKFTEIISKIITVE